MNAKKCKALRRGIRKLMPTLTGQPAKYKGSSPLMLAGCFRKVYKEAKEAWKGGRLSEVNAILALGVRR